MKRTNLAILSFAVFAIACGNDPITNAGYFDDDVDRSVDSSVHDDHSQNNTTIYNIDESQHNDNSTTITTIVDSVIVIRDTIKYNTLDTVHVIVKDTVKHTKIDTTHETVYDTVHVLNTDTLYRTVLDTIRKKVTVNDTVRKTIVDTNIVRVEVVETDTVAPTLTSDSEVGSLQFSLRKSNLKGHKDLLVSDESADYGSEIVLTYKADNRTYTIKRTISGSLQTIEVETVDDCITITEIHLINHYSDIEYESYKGAKTVCVG